MKSRPFRFFSKSSIAGAVAKQLAHGGCTVLSDAGRTFQLRCTTRTITSKPRSIYPPKA